jgi:hypothetical protein
MIVTPATHLLKLTDVAAELRVSEATLDKWVFGKHPVLASFKKDATRRVSVEELTRFVLLHTVRPHRPEWLTTAVESEFRNLLRDLVRQELNAANMERKAA